MKPSKCVFGVQNINFFGHNISPNGILPSNDKIESIKNFPRPRNLKQLQRFLGMINFYHRFLPNISNLLTPLYSLASSLHTQNQKKFDSWSEGCNNSFNKAKLLLSKTTHLARPCKDKSPRQTRYLNYITQFSTDIRYIKGEANVIADALSRQY